MGRAGERGFALLVVLGVMPALALLGSQVGLTGRTDLRLAGNLRGAAVREAAADGAIREAIFRVVGGDWAPDGVEHIVRLDREAVAIRIESEATKINPSVAPLPLLRGLLLSVGEEASRAESLAAAIYDYRDERPTPSPHGAKAPDYRAAGKPYGPSGAPFQRLDELRLVLGMTKETYERLLPHLSVHTGQWIDVGHADPVVRAAYRLAGPNGGYFNPIAAGNGLLVSIHARGLDREGASEERVAVVAINDAATPDQPFEIREWSSAR